MALLPVVTVPDPRLRQTAAPVTAFDRRLAQLIDNMLETMYDAPGIGLAAPQVGLLERVIVVDVTRSEEKPEGEPFAMANPELLWLSEELCVYPEGCLSIPGQFADITRPDRIRVGWHDRDGKRHEMEAGGWLGRCIQHEIDHLNGILFPDHLSALKRDMLMRKYEKTRKKGG
ncbi:MAG: peptide deformylase [Pseudomonadota bacterium]|nr:peptide deformylase [Pseudomonadota bacterium]